MPPPISGNPLPSTATTQTGIEKVLGWPIGAILQLSINQGSGQLIEVLNCTSEGVTFRYLGGRVEHQSNWFEWNDMVRGARRRT